MRIRNCWHRLIPLALAVFLMGAAARPPLVEAARNGDKDGLRALVQRGTNVNARAARGQTALMWAVAQKHPDVVKALLAHGADVHARSEAWSDVMAVVP